MFEDKLELMKEWLSDLEEELEQGYYEDAMISISTISGIGNSILNELKEKIKEMD